MPLALRIEAFGHTGRTWLASVYEDGKVLTPGVSYGDYGDGAWMLARQLTRAGIDTLRRTITDTGLFDRSADYQPIALPGAEPPARGAFSYRVILGAGADAVTVWWVALFGDDALYYEPSPERETLDTMAEKMTAFDLWLPASAWAVREPCTVQAARFRVWVEAQAGGGSPAEWPPDISDVAWPLGGDIFSWGAEVDYDPPLEPDQVVRCGVASRADAARLVDELLDAGALELNDPPIRLDTGPYLWFWLGDRASTRIVSIGVQPLLPDDNRCSDQDRPGSSEV